MEQYNTEKIKKIKTLIWYEYLAGFVAIDIFA